MKVAAPVIPDAAGASPQHAVNVATAGGTLAKMSSPERAAAPTIEVAQTPGPETRQPRRSYELLGTTLAPDGDSALLRDPANEEHWTVRAGDRIDDASVTEIRADRVVLTSTQGPELLFFATRVLQTVVQPSYAGVGSSAAIGMSAPALPGSAAPAPANVTPPARMDVAPPASGTVVPVPQYTGPGGDTPTYVEPADEEQVTGH